MGQAELLVDALLVGVDCLRADEQLFTDFRRAVATSDELENVLLTLREFLELRALVSVLGSTLDALCQRSRKP